MLLRTPARFAPSATPQLPASCNSGRDSMTRRIWIVALLAVAWAVSLLPAHAGPRRAGLRPVVGQQLLDSGLGPVLSLSVCVLSPELLGQRILSQRRQLVLSLSARDADSGLQPPLAQRVSESTQVLQREPLRSRCFLSHRPGDFGQPNLCVIDWGDIRRRAGTSGMRI